MVDTAASLSSYSDWIARVPLGPHGHEDGF
jgi:hypothetical protein